MDKETASILLTILVIALQVGRWAGNGDKSTTALANDIKNVREVEIRTIRDEMRREFDQVREDMGEIRESLESNRKTYHEKFNELNRSILSLYTKGMPGAGA